MDEDIISSIEPDKPEPLAIVEPFHCPFSFHTVLLSSTHRHNERISPQTDRMAWNNDDKRRINRGERAALAKG